MINFPNEYRSDSIQSIVEQLKEGQVVAYPTESVFGLGCDPDNNGAIRSLLSLKQRTKSKGLIIIAANYQQLLPYIDDKLLTEKQKEYIFSFWPGPVTWIIPAKETTSEWLTGQFSSLAVRVSDHKAVQELCLAFGKPIVSTSANLSGLAPCRSFDEVKQQFGDDFPVLRGKVEGRNKPSEIRDALTGFLFREG